MYPIIDSKMMSNEPPSVAEFGPPTVKMFGKLGMPSERWDEVVSSHCSESEVSRLRLIEKRGRKEVSKPVVHTMASTCFWRMRQDLDCGGANANNATSRSE
jgi:hypothetical protein